VTQCLYLSSVLVMTPALTRRRRRRESQRRYLIEEHVHWELKTTIHFDDYFVFRGQVWERLTPPLPTSH